MWNRCVWTLAVIIQTGCLMLTGCFQTEASTGTKTLSEPSKEQRRPLISEKLRARAVRCLRKGMRKGQEWVKVHAAEELVWNDYPQDVRATFLDELSKNPKPPYRIGVWRVMAQAAGKGTAEHEVYVGKIRDAFLDPNGPDRIHAGETLGKLGYAERLDEIVRIAADPKKDSVCLMARWILANSGDTKDEQYLAEFLDSKDTAIRKNAAYALRWLKHLTAETLARLAKAAENEPIDSPASVYLLSALYVHSPETDVAEIKPRLLCYAMAGDSAQKSEVCHALSCRGDITDISLLEKLMACEELDVCVNASNAVLKILRRDSNKTPSGRLKDR